MRIDLLALCRSAITNEVINATTMLTNTEGRALVVLSVEEQVEIANIAIERRLNARQVEDLVNRRIRGEEEKPKPLVFKTNNYLSEKYSAHLSKFSAHSNTNLKVKIQEQGDKRKLTIDFETEEDLDIFVQGERPD